MPAPRGLASTPCVPAFPVEPLEPRSYLAAAIPPVPAPSLFDPTFGYGGIVTTLIRSDNRDSVTAVALTRDGRVITAGWTHPERGDLAPDGMLIARLQVDGTPDPSFGSEGTGQVVIKTGTYNGSLDPVALVLQKDGRIVAAVPEIGGVLFLRLLPTGALDTTFGGAGTGKVLVPVTGDYRRTARAVLRPNGRILVAGSFQVSDPRYNNRRHDQMLFIQMNADGTPDTSFGAAGTGVVVLGTKYDDRAEAIAQPADGSILAAGGSRGDFAVVRLTPAGRVDSTFGGTPLPGWATVDLGAAGEVASGIVVMPDGGIVVAGTTGGDVGLARLTAGGVPDTAHFGSGGKAKVDFGSAEDAAAELILTRAGQLVIAGTTGPWEGDAQFAAARFSATGAIDTAYGTGGLTTVDFDPHHDRAYAAAGYKDGRLVIAGGTPNFPGVDGKVARLGAGGGLDPLFGSDGKVVVARQGPAYFSVDHAVRLPEGRYAVVGVSDEAERSYGLFVRVYHADGTLDTTFSGDGLDLPGTQSVFDARAAARPGGGLLVAAEVNEADLMNPKPVLYLVAYDRVGLDASFGAGGIVRLPDAAPEVRAVTVDGLGRILVVAYGGGGWTLWRFTAAGQPDASFGAAGRVTTPLPGHDVGDPKFVAVDGVGRIVVAGTAIDTTGTPAAFAAARYLDDGQLDPSYGSGGVAVVSFPAPDTGAFANNAALLQGGSLLIGGYSNDPHDAQFALARLTPAGQLDTTFGDGGRVLVNPHVPAVPDSRNANDDSIRDLVFLPDGRILALGWSQYPIGSPTGPETEYVSRSVLARFTAAGALDTTFDADGLLDVPFDGGDRVPSHLVLQPSDAGDKVIIVGNSLDAIVMRRVLEEIPKITMVRSGTELIITGTGADDVIRVVRGPRGEVYLDAGLAFPSTGVSFTRMTFRGLGGNDVIDVEAMGHSGIGFSAAYVPVVLDGGGGDDLFVGAIMDDVLYGGAGDDTLVGGVGNDTLFGHYGNDSLDGDLGDDYLNGGPDADTVYGGAGSGNDQVFAVDASIDTIDGFLGYDRAKADPDDVLTGIEGPLA